MTGAQAINREIVDLTIMSGRKDEPDGPAARTFRFQIPQRETTVQGIGPLTPLDHQGGSVKPIADKRLARRLRSAACALRGLVLVMRENQILAPPKCRLKLGTKTAMPMALRSIYHPVSPRPRCSLQGSPRFPEPELSTGKNRLDRLFRIRRRLLGDRDEGRRNRDSSICRSRCPDPVNVEYRNTRSCSSVRRRSWPSVERSVR